MSNEPSPRPWKCGETVDRGCLIIDATGRCLANTQYGINNDMATNRANAQLICDAVNERDRLQNEVREAGELLQSWLSELPGEARTVAWLKRNGFDDPYPEITAMYNK